VAHGQGKAWTCAAAFHRRLTRAPT
jgi:hypothetical protein